MQISSSGPSKGPAPPTMSSSRRSRLSLTRSSRLVIEAGVGDGDGARGGRGGGARASPRLGGPAPSSGLVGGHGACRALRRAGPGRVGAGRLGGARASGGALARSAGARADGARPSRRAGGAGRRPGGQLDRLRARTTRAGSGGATRSAGGEGQSRGSRAGGASPGRAGPARAQRSARPGAHLPAGRGATDRRRRREHRLRGGAGAGRGAARGARGCGPDAARPPAR